MKKALSLALMRLTMKEGESILSSVSKQVDKGSELVGTQEDRSAGSLN